MIGLGVGQIVSWGQLYYSIAVLWPAIAQDLVLSQTMVYGIVSAALLVNGLCLPYTGQWIDRAGGRPVMMTGSVVAAATFLILAVAQSTPVYALGWLIGGAAMSMTMYDPAFATLSQHSGVTHRRSLTAVTLFGGLASTVFWPLSAGLLDWVGWRGAMLAFAAMQLLICLPLHAWVIPSRNVRATPSPAESRASAAPMRTPAGERISARLPAVVDSRLRRLFAGLAVAYMLHALVASLVAVHLMSLLQHRGLSLSDAVWVGMAIGPAQVAGRMLDFIGGDRVSAARLGIVAFTVITLSMLVLVVPAISLLSGLAICMLWGLGNGLLTIARGIIVAERFPRNEYGAWMGRLSRWSFVSNALAPALFALALAAGLPESTAGWLFACLTGGGLLAYLYALRQG